MQIYVNHDEQCPRPRRNKKHADSSTPADYHLKLSSGMYTKEQG